MDRLRAKVVLTSLTPLLLPVDVLFGELSKALAVQRLDHEPWCKTLDEKYHHFSGEQYRFEFPSPEDPTLVLTKMSPPTTNKTVRPGFVLLLMFCAILNSFCYLIFFTFRNSSSTVNSMQSIYLGMHILFQWSNICSNRWRNCFRAESTPGTTIHSAGLLPNR